MKLTRLIMLTVIVMGASAWTSLSAQTNLQQWMKSVEKNENVKITLIVSKNPKTKEETSRMHSFSFKGDPSLLTSLKAAAQKDKDDAIKIIENSSGGEFTPQVYDFYDEKTETTTSYIFVLKGTENRGSLVVTQNGPSSHTVHINADKGSTNSRVQVLGTHRNE